MFNKKSQEQINLSVQYAYKPSQAPGKATIRKWISASLASISQKATISIRFVGLKEGRELNASFRNKDYATNVLTFPMGEASDALIQGDLVLCEPVVEKEAQEQNKPLEAHYALLIVHGILHLREFDHENDIDAEEMEALERQILEALEFKRDYD